MDVQLQLILVACIANSELTYAQHDSQRDQAVDTEKNGKDNIQENLRSLFDSMTKNDPQKSGIFRAVLERKIGWERQAFDFVKEDLRTKRHRNSYKNRNVHEKVSLIGKKIVAKRETNEEGNHGTGAEPAQKMKKLPIGIESIREILQNDYIYVDKTGFVRDLLFEHRYDYLIVRPKGFGKTLLLSTLEEIFNGNKDLFEGTAIHRSNYNWLKYKVLHFDFSRMACNDTRQFERALKEEMKEMGEVNGVVPVEGLDLQHQLRRLVEDLSKKSGARVVILVDEYDAPITNSLADMKMAEKFRNLLSNFLTVVTSLSNEFLQFTFITGVNQYSVCGPQGCGQDQLVDITLDPKYATLLGFTREELETHFSDYINQSPGGGILDEARGLCNGYRFTEREDSIYNPLSILTYLDAQHPQNFSYHEKIPSYLLDMIRKDPQIMFNLRSSATAGFSLGTPIDTSKRVNLEPFLFQLGYLTVHGFNARDNWGYYELDFRNEEVKSTFFGVVLEGLTALDRVEIRRDGEKMRQDLAALDVNGFIATLYIHMSGIPIQFRHDATLEYYRAIFYLLMENYGLDTSTELRYSSTKISDLVVLFKFTLDQSSEAALARVMETQTNHSKKILCVGVNFSVRMSNIDDWKAVLIEDGKVARAFPSHPESFVFDSPMNATSGNDTHQER